MNVPTFIAGGWGYNVNDETGEVTFSHNGVEKTLEECWDAATAARATNSKFVDQGWVVSYSNNDHFWEFITCPNQGNSKEDL